MAFSRAGFRVGGFAVAAAAAGSFWYGKQELEAAPAVSTKASFTAPMDLACEHERVVDIARSSFNARQFVAASAPAESAERSDDAAKKTRRLKKRERRFKAFASCEYEGQLFMTAQDFLESVTKEEPRAREKRRQLSKQEVEKMLKSTPGLGKASTELFRTMWSSSLLSYPDYLFLLSILTKPQQHFEVAFRMLDVDGNKQVDAKEFRKFQQVVNQSSALSSGHEEACSSLLVHFFDQQQRSNLKFPEFFKFMENLQTEVLVLEFLEFSQGMVVIGEIDFAEILLRTSHISSYDAQVYKERLRERITVSKGITFEQFVVFNRFLNNLGDFAIAMKMFTIAGQAVTQGEFQRAAKASMGVPLDAHVVDIIFKIFDADGDGRLSHEEFVAVMRHRVQRGFEAKTADWNGFVACIKKQVSK